MAASSVHAPPLVECCTQATVGVGRPVQVRSRLRSMASDLASGGQTSRQRCERGAGVCHQLCAGAVEHTGRP
eukprot:3234560-Prymnesium_polylepis.1